MRDIIKNIQLPVDGKPVDFRLTKLDAFSGAELMQMLTRTETDHPETSACHPECSEGSLSDFFLTSFFASLTPADLRSLMISCLNHVEVLLPAGYQPVMQGSSWSWPELEHDTASCLKLTLEEALWTLSGFFGKGGPTSRPAAPTSSPPHVRT